ncbi:MAG TPA: 2-oxo acid dehydrogenase subunit E2, partial [Pyrinomonadaceae bacterium]|nr:2-oxo acid dehydrogenase subunit E2 [Pyrinomonadaceae bacterium]
MTTQRNQTDLSAFIADNFGANATYVESLLQRFRSDPALVDEAWRAYFTELLGAEATSTAQVNGGASVAQATTEPRPTEPATAQTTTTTPATQQQTAPAPTAAQPAPVAQAAPVDGAPIRGAALKIVENMETSLNVPTATSNRQVPVKVLEENRLIINRHLQERAQRKVSFTHLIAFALLRAFDKFPQMNDAFAVVNGTATRLRRPQVNLGV